MQRNAMKILRSYYEAAKQLASVSKELACDYWMAIMAYGLDDEEPQIDGIAGAMFLLAKPNIDNTLKMSDGGTKGGKASKPTQSLCETYAKPIESLSKAYAKPTQSLCETYAKPIESLSKAYAKPTQSLCEQDIGCRKKDIGDRSNNPPYPPRGAAKREKEQQFEEFWSKYPKKVAKSAAKKAFERVSAPLETLLTAIERQKCSEQWSKDNGQFIPNPATWLNQERWNDELPKGNTPNATTAHGKRELDADDVAAIRQIMGG